MKSRLFPADDFIRKAKCIKCRKYLSVPPIIITSNQRVCGRCFYDVPYSARSRDSLYESIAKYIFFPCINNEYGCNVQLPWGKVRNHEISCKFMRMACPVINCKNKITRYEIKDHFENKHQNLIMKQDQYEVLGYTCNTTEKAYSNKLFLWKDQTFIVQFLTDEESTFLRISNLEDDILDKVNVKLIFTDKRCSNSLCLDEFKITKYESKYPRFLNTERVNVNAIKNVLGSEINYILDFDDGLVPQKIDTNNKMPSELICASCACSMVPPIFMCSKSHNICSFCIKNLLQCPSCSSILNDTRNYSLERIAELISYPCRYKNRGCDFLGSIEKIKNHESSCPKSIQNKVSCFVNHIAPCKWQGNYLNFYSHIIAKHPDYYFNVGSTVSINLVSFKWQTWFMKYDNKIFRFFMELVVKKYGTKKIRFSVGCIEQKEVKNQYMFYLDIVSDKRIFVVSENCYVILANSQTVNCTTFVDLTKELLCSFVKKDMLNFKINIANVL